jgi:hypothetical protein
MKQRMNRMGGKSTQAILLADDKRPREGNGVPGSAEGSAFLSEFNKILDRDEVLAIQSVFNRKQANTVSLIYR